MVGFGWVEGSDAIRFAPIKLLPILSPGLLTIGSKKAKMVKSAGKVMVQVFWDAHRIIHIDYLDK